MTTDYSRSVLAVCEAITGAVTGSSDGCSDEELADWCAWLEARASDAQWAPSMQGRSSWAAYDNAVRSLARCAIALGREHLERGRP